MSGEGLPQRDPVKSSPSSGTPFVAPKPLQMPLLAGPYLLPDVFHLLLQQLIPLGECLVLLQQRLADPSSQL